MNWGKKISEGITGGPEHGTWEAGKGISRESLELVSSLLSESIIASIQVRMWPLKEMFGPKKGCEFGLPPSQRSCVMFCSQLTAVRGWAASPPLLHIKSKWCKKRIQIPGRDLKPTTASLKE